MCIVENMVNCVYFRKRRNGFLFNLVKEFGIFVNIKGLYDECMVFCKVIRMKETGFSVIYNLSSIGRISGIFWNRKIELIYSFFFLGVWWVMFFIKFDWGVKFVYCKSFSDEDLDFRGLVFRMFKFIGIYS